MKSIRSNSALWLALITFQQQPLDTQSSLCTPLVEKNGCFYNVINLMYFRLRWNFGLCSSQFFSFDDKEDYGGQISCRGL